MVSKKILVVGATGKQGGAVVDALLALGSTNITIKALTRNPASSAAQKLASQGVEVCKGDLTDRGSLVAALAGVEAAYLVTDYNGPEDVSGEIKQGHQFVDCAKEAGIKHLVFSSAAGADIAKSVDHCISKYDIEQYIHKSGLNWTVIRPVGFMENIPPSGIGRFIALSAMASLLGDTPQRYVACDDIGKAVSIALMNPEKYYGRTETMCGQIATVDEMQKAIEAGEGRKGWGRIWFPRWLLIRLTPHHFRQLFDWFYYEQCQPGSVKETREIIGDVMDIETWARRQQAKRSQ